MAKSVYVVRIESDEYTSIEELLDKAGYDNELLEEYEGDGEDGIERGITQIVGQKENSIKRVYLVRQTQNESEGMIDDIYKNETIYVLTDENEAIKRARELNKEYGHGCKFSEDYDFEEIDYDEIDTGYHYYDVETMLLDKPMA